MAQSHSGDERSKNVEYSFQNARHTSFDDSFFDIAYSRRGPTFYKEYHRILKTNGYYLEIGIGEMDTIELKKIFGRGQGYGTFRRTHITLQDDTYIADGAIDFLNWANQQGKNLHVISNSPAFVIETYIKQIEASGYRAGFTHVISARDIGRESRKPHPAGFQQLLDSFHPQEDIMQALYIGNEQGDVLFATNATDQLKGIHVVPVLITRGLDYSHIKMPPHCRFPSFTHLKEFLISPTN